MYKYKCEKCGHDGLVPLIVNLVEWESKASSGLKNNLMQKKFDKVWGTGFETLFISATQRNSVIDEFVPGSGKQPLQVFEEKILPALETINKEFKIIGHLALPSSMNLAITDLTKPFAVFCFPVVQYEGYKNLHHEPVDLKLRLKELDLPWLLMEGASDTVVLPWRVNDDTN